MDLAERVTTARTFLFVPGDRPDRFGRAAASGADVVVLDLEDAVADHAKAAAQDHAVAWVEAGHPVVVRVNARGTRWHAGDLAALAATGRPVAVMLPKAQRAADVDAVQQSLPPGTPVVPLVETPLGVLQAQEVASATATVRLAFGSIDLASGLGIDPTDRVALAHSRSVLVLASAAAGLAGPVDGVTTSLRDPEVLAADVRHQIAMGFTGKLCIHPAQVEPTHELVAPSEEQLDWAREVLEAGATAGVVAVRGAMVDAPVLTRARALLASAAGPARDPRSPALSSAHCAAREDAPTKGHP